MTGKERERERKRWRERNRERGRGRERAEDLRSVETYKDTNSQRGRKYMLCDEKDSLDEEDIQL